MRQQIDWFKGKPLESYNLNHRAWAAMCLGQIRRAREFFDASRASAQQNDMKEYAAATANDQAQIEADLGNFTQARAKASLALKLGNDSEDVKVGAAFALARVGYPNPLRFRSGSKVRTSPCLPNSGTNHSQIGKSPVYFRHCAIMTTRPTFHRCRLIPRSKIWRNCATHGRFVPRIGAAPALRHIFFRMVFAHDGQRTIHSSDT
jgi:HEAT repeat protein